MNGVKKWQIYYVEMNYLGYVKLRWGGRDEVNMSSIQMHANVSLLIKQKQRLKKDHQNIDN